ncbi:MAG: hypothetical protein JNM27_03495 [Leptospirales bacterium]|nr:hypothetical protein [Leptospirales bacterium]
MNPHLELLVQSFGRAEALAAAIGFDDFRAGRHVSRDHRNWKTGESEVAATWIGLLMPSFSDHRAVITFDVSRRVREHKELSPLRRTAIAAFERNSITPFDIQMFDSERKPDDPLTGSLAELPWNSPEWHVSLDGTLYAFLSETMTLSGFLLFANPTDRSLLRLVELLKDTEAEVREKGTSANFQDDHRQSNQN